jgi:hypothetical protein
MALPRASRGKSAPGVQGLSTFGVRNARKFRVEKQRRSPYRTDISLPGMPNSAESERVVWRECPPMFLTSGKASGKTCCRSWTGSCRDS